MMPHVKNYDVNIFEERCIFIIMLLYLFKSVFNINDDIYCVLKEIVILRNITNIKRLIELNDSDNKLLHFSELCSPSFVFDMSENIAFHIKSLQYYIVPLNRKNPPIFKVLHDDLNRLVDSHALIQDLIKEEKLNIEKMKMKIDNRTELIRESESIIGYYKSLIKKPQYDTRHCNIICSLKNGDCEICKDNAIVCKKYHCTICKHHHNNLNCPQLTKCIYCNKKGHFQTNCRMRNKL